MTKKHRILITPLNWGLGHATRCMPIINALLKMGQEVLLASDGRALALLRQEYPSLPAFELPGYNIVYKETSMTWNIARQLPKISGAILSERKYIKRLVKAQRIDIIISDNRYGCRHRHCKNIFITHQINIAIPNPRLAILTNAINQQFINRFNTCWIPDFPGENSLAGKLSKGRASDRYIGPLSRFEHATLPKEYDLIAVLSGPEPQRSLLEKKIKDQLLALPLKSLIVQGKTEFYEEQQLSDNVKTISFLTASALNQAMLKSDVILARSGYSTIMDLVALRKKAVLIPTPGQTEQEYLAERLQAQGLFYTQTQEDFHLPTALKRLNQYTGFQKVDPATSLLQEALQDLCDVAA